MAQLASFSSLTKKQDDLLGKGFCFGNAFALGIYRKAAEGVTFTGKAAAPHGSGVPTSKVQFGYKFGDFDFKESITEKSAYKLTCDYVLPNKKDVTLSGELNCSPDNCRWSFSVQQLLSQARYKFSVDKTLAATLSLVAGKPDKGFGLNLVFNGKEKKLTTYDATAYFKFGEVSLALKHISKPSDALQLGNLQFLMHQQVKPKLAVAARVTYDAANEKKKMCAEVAANYEMAANRSMAVKVNCDGVVTTSHRSKLWENISLIYSMNMQPLKAGTPTDFGFKIKVNA